MSTLNDVAKLAGVSAMTVSRVINNSGYTSNETRSRVEAAIAELAYVPNAVGRQLRSKRTNMLALVLSDIMNPFFTTIARGVEDVARAQGFTVMFCNTDESEAEEAQYLLMLVQRQVDGVLLVPASTSDKSLRLLSSHYMPVVVLDRRIQSRQVDSVRSDSVAGAYALTEHLVALGHRRIAVLTGRRSVSTSADRVAGYRRAMVDAGLPVDDALVRHGEYNQGDGYRMAQEILALDARPTAIFAANNFIAFGAIRAFREAGLRIPEDVSVVAFDDLPAAWMTDPFLTVVDQPAYEIGRRGAELLLARLDGSISGPGREVILQSELIIRRSSAQPAISGPTATATSQAVVTTGVSSPSVRETLAAEAVPH